MAGGFVSVFNFPNFDTPPPIHFECGKGFRLSTFLSFRVCCLDRSGAADGFFGFGRSSDSIPIPSEEREGESVARLGFPAGIVVILIESTSNGKGEMGKWEGEGIFSLQEK